MKQVLVVLMLGLLAGCGSGGGGSPSPVQAQTPQYVTVTNDPLRVELANGTMPVTVNVTVDPALLAQSKQVVGLNPVCSTSRSVETVYTVPQGKTFILTDLVGSGCASCTGAAYVAGTISRRVGSTDSAVLAINNGSAPSLHLTSGYDFGPGSQVLYSNTTNMCVSLSGYLTPA